MKRNNVKTIKIGVDPTVPRVEYRHCSCQLSLSSTLAVWSGGEKMGIIKFLISVDLEFYGSVS